MESTSLAFYKQPVYDFIKAVETSAPDLVVVTKSSSFFDEASPLYGTLCMSYVVQVILFYLARHDLIEADNRHYRMDRLIRQHLLDNHGTRDFIADLMDVGQLIIRHRVDFDSDCVVGAQTWLLNRNKEFREVVTRDLGNIRSYAAQELREHSLRSKFIPILSPPPLADDDGAVDHHSPCCCICLEDMDCRQMMVVKLKVCPHIFHATCIATWLRIRNTCPTCRCSLSERA